MLTIPRGLAGANLLWLRLWSKCRIGDGCWEWTSKSVDRDGYPMIRMWPRKTRAHRLAYEIAVGPIPRGMLVCHHCDNPKCIKPSHLFLGTHSDNMRDMVKKGRGTGFSEAARRARWP